MNVLIVDDEPQGRERLSRLLGELGWQQLDRDETIESHLAREVQDGRRDQQPEERGSPTCG